MNDVVIRFSNVEKSFPLYRRPGIKTMLLNPRYFWTLKERFVAIKDISFEVYRGETFGIVGKNGAGKSTILGLIAGVLVPDRGRVEVRGKVVPLLELGAGFHHELNAVENIMLNGVLLGASRRKMKALTGEILEFAGLKEFAHQPIRTFSTGMLARLGFSIAVHIKPEILLVDEILAVGDSEFQKKCLEKISELQKSNVTILLVSHDAKQIERFCKRAMLIEDKHIKLLGEAKEVIKAYAG
ncbi:MAG: ABC transporter ATP-binding protein [Aquificaceae bacterium]